MYPQGRRFRDEPVNAGPGQPRARRGFPRPQMRRARRQLAKSRYVVSRRDIYCISDGDCSPSEFVILRPTTAQRIDLWVRRASKVNLGEGSACLQPVLVGLHVVDFDRLHGYRSFARTHPSASLVDSEECNEDRHQLRVVPNKAADDDGDTHSRSTRWSKFYPKSSPTCTMALGTWTCGSTLESVDPFDFIGYVWYGTTVEHVGV